MPEKLPDPPIQTLPIGLLGLLGIQNGGRYPQRLESNALTPTLDAGNLYYHQLGATETAEQAQVVASVGFINFAQLTASPGELLALMGVSIRTDTLAAGEAISYYGPCFRYVNNALVGDTQQGLVTVAATGSGIVSKCYDTPLLLPPGWSVGMYVNSFTVGADVTASIWFARLLT